MRSCCQSTQTPLQNTSSECQHVEPKHPGILASSHSRVPPSLPFYHFLWNMMSEIGLLCSAHLTELSRRVSSPHFSRELHRGLSLYRDVGDQARSATSRTCVRRMQWCSHFSAPCKINNRAEIHAHSCQPNRGKDRPQRVSSRGTLNCLGNFTNPKPPNGERWPHSLEPTIKTPSGGDLAPCEIDTLDASTLHPADGIIPAPCGQGKPI